jgi:hypothetical protein
MMAPRPQLFQAIVLIVCSAFSIPAQAQCTWFKDRDADGFGDPASTTSAPCHVALPGYVLNKRDCNDTFLNAAEWAMVGAAAVDPDAAVMTDLEIAVDGTLYVLYRKNTGSNPTAVVAVHMFNGTSWVAVGPDPVNFSDQMYAADLALDGNGVPYIAFADGDVGGKVTVIRYNSSSGSWAVVGSRGMSAQDVISDGTASLAFDGNNIPHVFYVSPSGDAFVMRYDPAGNVWQELGGGAFASAGSTEYSLKIGISNIPYAVFTESDTRIP